MNAGDSQNWRQVRVIVTKSGSGRHTVAVVTHSQRGREAAQVRILARPLEVQKLSTREDCLRAAAAALLEAADRL